MSELEVRVVHQIPGRARLRLPLARGQSAFLEQLARELAACSLVRDVQTSSITGSILILHDGQWDDVVRFAHERNLFSVPIQPAQDVTPIEGVAEAFQKLDERLRGQSQERWSIGSVTFYGLLGAVTYQIAQGRILPPAGTLIFQAMTVFLRTLDADGKRRANSPAA